MKTKETMFALARISLGWIFLWAFLDKAFDLGFTLGFKAEKGVSWLAGGSPTAGFLEHATHGPFSDVFASLAGAPWVDWMFMLGLLFIGVALILGIGIRLAGFFGGVLVLLMFAAAIPPKENPFIDEHIVYAFVLFAFASSDVGETLGFGKQWRRSALVKKFPLLK